MTTSRNIRDYRIRETDQQKPNNMLQSMRNKRYPTPHGIWGKRIQTLSQIINRDKKHRTTGLAQKQRVNKPIDRQTHSKMRTRHTRLHIKETKKKTLITRRVTTRRNPNPIRTQKSRTQKTNPSHICANKITNANKRKHQDPKKSQNKQPETAGKETTNELNIMYVNVNGIQNKVDSLVNAIKCHESHIVALTETKLESYPPYIEGYKWMTKNRKNKQGGGVAFMVKEELVNRTKQAQGLEDQEQEVLWIEIQNHNKTTSIGVYYGPQESEKREEVERQYSQLITQVTKQKGKGEVILTGDFNAKLSIKTPEKNQHTSKNGEQLERLIEVTNLKAVSLKADKGVWTRINRKNPRERSVIDYIITSETISSKITELIIDEEGIYRIKGKEETDHNTIITTVQIPHKKETTKIRRWKLNNTEGWNQYNERIEKVGTKMENYTELEKLIVKTMENTIGQTTITIGNKKKKETEEIKKLREKKKIAKQEFTQACKQNGNKESKLHQYVSAQISLKKQIEKTEREEIRHQAERIAKEGGCRSQEFWKIRRKIIGNKPVNNYDTITENNEHIKDPDQTKEYIAQYFENLYQARTGKEEYKRWTEHIDNTVQEIERSMQYKRREKEITPKELTIAIKQLKRKKSTGPDQIPNEIFIEASELTKEIYRKNMNKILKAAEIPEQWQHGEIIRLYKGKGIKGKCSNERGISLTSNYGKVFERIINNRARKMVHMTDAQAGGTKGRATADHIMVLNDLIAWEKRNRKSIHIAFLDVTKAYDKAWLNAIMYTMYMRGVNSNLWNIIKKLNENLTATIKTKHGNTRKIKIRDSIRQGGVLSVMQYALIMDEIAKEVQKKNLGVDIDPNQGKKVGCLLWMDDVALIAPTEKEMQQMLNITYEIASRFHIEFGKSKSQIMTINQKRNETQQLFKLGEMDLDNTQTYKYLGIMYNDKLNRSNQLTEMNSKAEAAYQTVLTIAKDTNFRNIEMETIWKLVETCVVPVITYAGETWQGTKKETTQLNAILDKILRRVLKTPPTTPRETLYIETGLLDIQTLNMQKRMKMNTRLNKTQNQLIRETRNMNITRGWQQTTNQTSQKLQIQPQQEADPNNNQNSEIDEKVAIYFKQKITDDSQGKSKVQFLLSGINTWTPGNRAEYMNKLNRNECSAIFRARTRMTEVKNNYRGMYTNHTCRKCGETTETQAHVFEDCKEIHINNDTTVKQAEIFSKNTAILKITAKKIKIIIDKLTV